jgi:hypothetical protein
VADHAGAATDVSLGNGTGGRVGKRLKHVLGAHVEAVDVVEQSVVGLGDQREREPAVPAPRLDLGGDERVADDADRARVGDGDRRGHPARFAHPFEAGELAGAVEAVTPGEQRLVPDGAVVRNHHGDARPHRAFAHAPRTVAVDQRRVADAHAGNVGDRVVLARRQVTDGATKVSKSHRRHTGVSGRGGGQEKPVLRLCDARHIRNGCVP